MTLKKSFATKTLTLVGVKQRRFVTEFKAEQYSEYKTLMILNASTMTYMLTHESRRFPVLGEVSSSTG